MKQPNNHRERIAAAAAWISGIIAAASCCLVFVNSLMIPAQYALVGSMLVFLISLACLEV